MTEVYKGYIIKAPKGNPKCVAIAVEGRGGKIPDILGGLFTSPGIAKQHIDAYLASRPTKIKDKDNVDANQEITTG